MENQEAKSSPWDIFIHLLAVIALYVSIYSVISLLFKFIELALPDPLDKATFWNDPYDSIRWSVSSLIIFFPAYWWSWRQIEIDLAANPGKRRWWIRTCPIYLTLFLAGLLILVDLSCLVYYFMGGELTTRFVLKVASILVVAGAVMHFYRDALKRDPGPMPSATANFVRVGGAAVAAITVAGFVLAGSPMRARLVKTDAERVRDLFAIQGKVVNYWAHKDKMPNSLSDLTDSISGFTPPTDPQTKVPYGYRITGANSFELCADFHGAADEKTNEYVTNCTRGVSESNWQHPAGRFCYPRKIDADLYRKGNDANSCSNS